MGADSETLDFYSREAAAYADYVKVDEARPQLDRFAAMLPPGGAILDFGCGPAWAAHHFAGRGFRADGYDGSQGLADEARRRFGITVTVGPFDAFGAVAAYDGIWASFSLLHDTRDAMPGHLARLHRALHRGGVLYLGLKSGTGEARDDFGRLYTYFTLPEVTGLLEAAGFTVTDHEHGEGTGMDGTVSKFFHVFARRA